MIIDTRALSAAGWSAGAELNNENNCKNVNNLYHFEIYVITDIGLAIIPEAKSKYLRQNSSNSHHIQDQDFKLPANGSRSRQHT